MEGSSDTALDQVVIMDTIMEGIRRMESEGFGDIAPDRGDYGDDHGRMV